MNFIKKNMKWFIVIIIVAILASGISVYATTYLASNITYTRTGKNVNTVGEALDDIYNTQSGIAQTDATAGDIVSGKKAYTTNGLVVGTLTSGNIGTYSSTPQVIGTWNGTKNIYRKILTGFDVTLTANTWTNICDVSSLGIDTLVNCVSYAKKGGVSGMNTNAITNAGAMIATNNYLQLFAHAGWVGVNTVVLEYTKTND